MAYTVTRIVGENSWIHKPSPNRVNKIAGVTLHSTRSGVEAGDDGPRTEAWFKNPNNNQGGWGASADEIIFENGTRMLVSYYEIEEPTYCAGYGDVGTWSMGEFYYQIEIAQGTLTEPFKDAAIDSLAYRVAELSVRHNFPIIKLGYIAQTGIPPRGINTHENCANGKKFGKSDPGPVFPWDVFLAKANQYRNEMLGGTPPASTGSAIMPVLTRVKEDGRVFVVGEKGKRHIGPAELSMYEFSGIGVSSKTSAEVNTVPDVDAVEKAILAKVNECLAAIKAITVSGGSLTPAQDALLKDISADLKKIRGPEDNQILAMQTDIIAASKEAEAKVLREEAIKQKQAASLPPN